MTNTRVCIASVNPKITSGYGVGCKTLCHMLIDAGYDICIYSVFGNYEYIDTYTYKDIEVKIYPSRANNKDRLKGLEHVELVENFDILFTFFDLFAFTSTEKKYPVVSWIMLDAEPFVSSNYRMLETVDVIVAVTNYAKEQLEQLRTKNIIKDKQKIIYMPLITNENEFFIEDKELSRRRFADYFKIKLEGNLFSCVAANLEDGGKERKNYPELILFWREWFKNHPKDVLYLHTDIQGVLDKGMNIHKLIVSLDVPVKNICFSNAILYEASDYDSAYMRMMYNASDFMIVPSHSEGFGIPFCEAAFCGCTPLGNGFGSGGEVVKNCNGELIECRRSYFFDGSFKSKSYAEDIYNAVNRAMMNKSDANRLKCNEMAMSEYSISSNIDRLHEVMNIAKDNYKCKIKQENLTEVKNRLYGWRKK